jgi:hypothetical protein
MTSLRAFDVTLSITNKVVGHAHMPIDQSDQNSRNSSVERLTYYYLNLHNRSCWRDDWVFRAAVPARHLDSLAS